MFKANVKIDINPQRIARKRDGDMREVQAVFTNKVTKDTEPFVPYDKGTLASSPIRSSNYEEGLIVYDTPYAKRLYYGVTFSFAKKEGHLQATHHWFEAAKARFLDAWGSYCARLLGGTWRRGG